MCSWWNEFVTKIINLLNLLESQEEFNYVLAGSSANAILTYFYKPELLSKLPQPNDGDILIIPKVRPVEKGKLNFNKFKLFIIGTYNLKSNQHYEKSGTFLQNESNFSLETFNSIDVNIESNIQYITINGIKILIPEQLIDRYKEFSTEKRKNSNLIKISVLEEVILEYREKFLNGDITIQNFKIHSSNDNRSRRNSRLSHQKNSSKKNKSSEPLPPSPLPPPLAGRLSF